MEIAYFAAGCFWGVEDTFIKTEGVSATEVGYMNGSEPDPNYRTVCGGNTGHAEAVKVIFNSEVINYKSLVILFFEIHNPTTMNQQGPDIGSQYRSGIFTISNEQFSTSNNIMNQLEAENRFTAPIVTIIEPAKEFYRAETYHQQYLKKNGGGTCKL